MRKLSRVYFGLGLLVLFSLVPNMASAKVAEVKVEEGDFSTTTIIRLTNEDRTALKLNVLKNNQKLEKAAQMKAEYLAKNVYFAHDTKDNQKPWYWFELVNYKIKYAGENLGVLFSTPSELKTAWMNSPSHKKNIINKNYQETGVGIAYGTYKGVKTKYVVQLFGTESKY